MKTRTQEKSCIICDKKLVGRQRKYCSNKCGDLDWKRIHAEEIKSKRNGEAGREYRQRYYAKNREKLLKQQKERRLKNPEKYSKIRKRCYDKYRRQRIDAQKIRVKTQTLYKAIICMVCGATGCKLELHHYTKPYQVDKVISVCEKCHKKIHTKYMVISYE